MVRDEATRRHLAEAAGQQHWIASAPIVIALCARLWNLSTVPEGDFGLTVTRTRYGDDFVSYLRGYRDQRAVSILFEEGVPSLAGEHMFLAAVSHGLRACWVGYLDVVKASRILHLPDGVACMDLMPVGYASGAPEDIDRKPLEEIVFHERWPAR